MKNNDIAAKLAGLACEQVKTNEVLKTHSRWIGNVESEAALMRADYAHMKSIVNHNSDDAETRLNKLEQATPANGSLANNVTNAILRLDNHADLLDKNEKDHIFMVDRVNTLVDRMDHLAAKMDVMDTSQKYIHDKVAVMHKDIREASPAAEEEPYEPSNAEILKHLKDRTDALSIITGISLLTWIIYFLSWIAKP